MAEFLTRHAKEKLINRYEDLKFIDDVSELSCKKCNRVPIDHYIANCGHLFCSDCQRILAVGKGWRCPECKADITDITRQDADVERRVSELKAHCPNGKYGCKVDGSLQHISDHLALCMEPRVANVPRLNTGSQTMETMMEKLVELSQQFQQLKDSHEKTMTWIITENVKMRQTIAENRLQDKDEFSSRLQKQVDRLDSKLTTADHEKTIMSNHLDSRMSDSDIRVATIDKNLSNINIKMAMIILLFISTSAIATAVLFAFNNEMHSTNENINNKVASLDSRMTAIGMTVKTIIDNQQTSVNENVADMEDRVTANEKDVTAIYNTLASIEDRVTANEKDVRTTNNTLTTIEGKLTLNELILDPVDILQNIASTRRSLKILAKFLMLVRSSLRNVKQTLNTKMTHIDKQLLAIQSINSLSNLKKGMKNDIEMKQTRERLRKAGELCTLKQIDGSAVCEYTWVVEDIEEEIENALSAYEILSEPFYTNAPGYHLQLGLSPNSLDSEYIGLQMYVIQGEFDNNVSWPFSIECEMAIVGRDGHEFKHHTINPTTETGCNRDSFAQPPLFNSIGCGPSRYIKSKTLLDNKDQYLINGNLKIKFLYDLDD